MADRNTGNSKMITDETAKTFGPKARTLGVLPVIPYPIRNFELGSFEFERFTRAGVTGAPPKIMKSSDLNKLNTFVLDITVLVIFQKF